MKTKKREELAKAPTYSTSIGNVRASVWSNETEGRIYHNITLGRRYRDGEKWAFSSSLNGVADVVHAIHALKQVLSEIVDAEGSHITEEV